jgi:hypothetical protein
MAGDQGSSNNGGATDTAQETRQPIGVMGTAQEAAGKIRMGAERAAERLPEAVATAQVAARDTQRMLDEMPNQALLIGTSFSLGLGVGLFLTGYNRLLVLVALVPAAAMAATLLNREGQYSSIGARGSA